MFTNTEISLDQYIELNQVFQELKEDKSSIEQEEFNLLILELFPDSEDLKQYFVEKGICPKCMTKLDLIPNGLEIYEYQGRKITKENYQLRCDYCNISYGNSE